HFGHDLVQAFADRLDVTLGRFLRRHLGHILVQLAQRLERQVRVDRLRAVPGEQRELMHLACRTRLHDQPGAGAQTLAHQVLMYRIGGSVSSASRSTASRFGRGPMKVTSDMTSSSRIGSIGGFVTCAKSCLKYLNRSWGRSDSTASGVSVPMEETGSSPAMTIGVTTIFSSSTV